MDEPINIILLSPKLQISNAFATVIPFYTIGIFPTGIISFENLSEPFFFWLDGVFEHELNHVFQLSHSNVPQIWRKIFRLPSVIYVFLIKIINPFPNVFLPRFILEGDAILKESLNQSGGRLYDGAARAFVYSQIRHYQHQIDKFTTQKLLLPSFNNPHLGNEIYLHGGYLMAMLAEKYSQDTIHSFFTLDKKKPTKKEIKKFKEEKIEKKLSPSFGKIFSFKYLPPFIKDITKSYFNHYLSSASQQSYTATPVLFESSICHPFNQSKEELFFLTSDFKSTPILRVFNKESKKWTDQKIDLPLGKVFKINNKYYARSSEYTAPNTVHYSLFSKGLKNNKAFDSKYVTDIKGDSTLHIDAKNNIEGFKLYFNDKLYTDVHSSALFDKNKNIYYFKQKGNRRVLYKNKSPLFSYKGYYGKLLEIDPKGTIYFIGASQYGSSIYQYHSGKISRASSSDTVIQAQKINNKEFIVCEVSPYKYEYKMAPQIITNEQPVFYKYHFKKDSMERKLASQKNKKRNIVKTSSNQNVKQKKLNYKPYSGLKKFRFAGGNLMAISFGLFSVLGSNLIASDYLMQNMIQLSMISMWMHYNKKNGEFDWNKENANLALLSYLNKVYRLNWTLGYGLLFNNTDGITEEFGRLSLKYPLLQEGRWSASLSSIHSIEKYKWIERRYDYFHDQEHELITNVSQTSTYESRYHSRGNFYMGYSQSFPFNYFLPNKTAELQVFMDHKYKQYKKYNILGKHGNGLKGGLIGETSLHIGRDFYWTSSASYAVSLNADINPVKINSYLAEFSNNVGNGNQTSLYADDTTIGSFVTWDVYGPLFQRRYTAKSIGTASMGGKKTFFSPSNLITTSFRSRWIVLETLLSSEPLPITSNEDGAINANRLYTDTTNNLLKILNPHDKKKFKSEYTHWLEWTFGLEYARILSNMAAISIGGAFGFRTPVKFWERKKNNNSDTSSGDTATDTSSDDIATATLSTESALNFLDPSFQFYIKIPF